VVEQHILNELLAIRTKQEEIAEKLAMLARLEERQLAHKGDLDRAFDEIRRLQQSHDELEKRVDELEAVNATKKPFWNLIQVAAAAIVGGVITKYMGI